MFTIDLDEDDVPNQEEVLAQRYPRITESEAQDLCEAAENKVEELCEQDFERVEHFQLGDMARLAVYLVRTTVESNVEGVEYVEAEDIEEHIERMGIMSLLVLKRMASTPNDENNRNI